MTNYRSDTLEGTLGGTPTAGDLGLTSINLQGEGTVTYVEPGWGALTTGVEYANGAYGELTAALPDFVFDQRAFKVFDPPVGGDCRILSYRTTLNSPLILFMEEDTGRLYLENNDGEESERSQHVYSDGNWYRPIFVRNAAMKRGWVHLLDKNEVIIETLELDCGGAALAAMREGCITDGVTFSIIFSTVRTTDSPLYPVRDDRPNILFIMLDDGSPNVFPHMSEYRRAVAEGVNFTNFVCTTPLCAPSRAALLSGKQAVNNGVLSNAGMGSWIANPSNITNSLTALLWRQGYRTGQWGKYFNGYDPDGKPEYPALYVPPGIDDAILADDATNGFEYVATSSVDGAAVKIDTTGGQKEEADFFTDVVADRMLDFIDDCVTNRPGQPFLGIGWPFTPHQGIGADVEDGGGYEVMFPPAPRDRQDSPNRPVYWGAMDDPVNGDLGDGQVKADIPWPDYGPLAGQEANWNAHPVNAPGWHTTGTISAGDLDDMHDQYYNRIRAVQSVNDLIAAVRQKLEDVGEADRTVIIISSDNGIRLGEHGNPFGKGTAYDEDSRLPWVVIPPGGTSPITVESIIQNVDLLPTCVELAKGTTPEDVDGRSLWGFVEGTPPASWRQTALMQYVSGDVGSWDDAQGTGEPPDWIAIRTREWLFVNYNDRGDDTVPSDERGEAYDLINDPGMTVNIWPDVPEYARALAQSLLSQFWGASGNASWEAALTSFSLTTEGGGATDAELVLGPCYVINGVDMQDPQRRWRTQFEGTRYPSVPPVSVADIPQTFGVTTVESGMQFGTGALVLNQLIQGADSSSLAANTVAMLSAFDTVPFAGLNTVTVGERPRSDQGVAWEALGQVLGDITPSPFGDGVTSKLCPIAIRLVTPWRSVSPVTWTFPSWFHNIGTQSVTPLTGSWGTIRSPIVRVKGPVKQVTMVDAATGMTFTWDGRDGDQGSGVGDGLTINQYLLINGQTWEAVVVDSDTWEFDGGLDVSEFLDAEHDFEDLWVLQPTIQGSNPNDRRVLITPAGVGRTTDTQLQIRAYKTRRA